MHCKHAAHQHALSAVRNRRDRLWSPPLVVDPRFSPPPGATVRALPASSRRSRRSSRARAVGSSALAGLDFLTRGEHREDGSGGSRVDLLFETRAGGAARRYFEIAGVVSRPLELLGLLFCYQPIWLQQIVH